MIKTRVSDVVRLVSQPDHANVSGYLAAHWGGVNGFARPGHYAGAVHAEQWREEVVLGIAQHDNGWWESEAVPPIDSSDGLPLGLHDFAMRLPAEAFEHWRRGVGRLAGEHPYAALLVSLHAYWLYAFGLEDLARGASDAYVHPLFSREDAADLVTNPELARRFLEELQQTQSELNKRLRRDQVFAKAVPLEHRDAHFKLLQVLDAMSLLLAFNTLDEQMLPDAPRAGWDDRVSIRWRPHADGRIVCDPFLFDADPLEVHMPMRVIPVAEATARSDRQQPLTRLHRVPLQTVRFEIRSA